MRTLRLLIALGFAVAFFGVVTPTVRAADVTASDVQSLIDAINAANKTYQTVTIDLTANATYALTTADKSPVILGGHVMDAGLGPTGLPTITANITINGGGATIQRQAAAKFRIFEVFGTGKLTLNNLTIIGGDPGGQQSGGGIEVTSGSLTLNNVVITGNNAVDGGGGIYNLGAMNISQSRIEKNTSEEGGGGIFNSDSPILGSAAITDSTITGNTTGDTGRGGGIFNESGVFTVNNTHVEGNAAFEGGGLFNDQDGELKIVGQSVVAGNRATARADQGVSPTGGGGINNIMGDVTITDSTVANNVTAGAGGALFDRYGTFTITNSLISGNSAVVGAGIVAFGGESIAGKDPRDGHISASGNCIAGNTNVNSAGKTSGVDGLDNDTDGPLVNAANNWWGSSGGPGGKGKGKGDVVTGNVTFSPFLTSAPAPCSAGLPTPIPTAQVAAELPSATPEAQCSVDPSAPYRVTIAPGTATVKITCDYEQDGTSITILAMTSSGLPLSKFNHPVKVCLQSQKGVLFAALNGGSPTPKKLPTTSEDGFVCVQITTPGLVMRGF